jgi:hypothetical protein
MITVSRAVAYAVPGYASQVHHATQGWSAGGRTDIDDLTFACQHGNQLRPAATDRAYPPC